MGPPIVPVTRGQWRVDRRRAVSRDRAVLSCEVAQREVDAVQLAARDRELARDRRSRRHDDGVVLGAQRGERDLAPDGHAGAEDDALGLHLRDAAVDGYTTATSVADALVELGVPFREAHHIVGALVARVESDGRALTGLRDEEVSEILRASGHARAADLAGDPASPGLLRQAAELEAALARPDVIGGTAPGRVAEALGVQEERLGLPAGRGGAP